MKHTRMITIALLVLITSFCAHARILDTFYGPLDIKEPLLLDLLTSPMIERLKTVHQYGLDYYVIAPEDYSRYDHSIGVMALLHRFGAPIIEQAAGLCHDGTHTIFSHVGDLVYRELSPAESYQDTYFDEIADMHGTGQVLARYALTVHDINPHKGNFHMLETELPDLCADRLEYNLQGGVLEGLITHDDVTTILKHLRYADNRWYFVDAPAARQFADLSIELSLTVWQSARGMLVDYLGAQLVRLALNKEIISRDEVHRAADSDMWNRLISSEDPEIQELVYKLLNYETCYTQTTADGAWTLAFKGKFRGINPWVKTQQGFVRLRELDPAYDQKFKTGQELLSQGWYFREVTPL